VVRAQAKAKYASVDAMNLSDDLSPSPFDRAQRAQVKARKRMLARRRDAPRRSAPVAIVPGRSEKQRLGSDYEQRALGHLLDAGLRLLACNAGCRMGEIDLVMRDGAVLVLVEVRARASGRFGGAGASITAAKQRRLIRAASLLMPALRQSMDQDLRATRQRPSAPPPVRFDVVTFEGQTIHWIQHAFALD